MLNIVENALDNNFLKRKKKALMNKFSPTKSKTIEDANLLCVWLVALGRVDEARDILSSYATCVPYDEFRPQRWEATCKAILLLSYLEKRKDNMDESDRLNSIVLSKDYIVGDFYKDKKKLFWEHVKGFNSIPGMVDPFEIKQTDLCIIYAQHFQDFIYFEQLKEHIEEFTYSDKAMLVSVVNENIATLAGCVRKQK